MSFVALPELPTSLWLILDKIEHEYLDKALGQAQNNHTEAAALLGLKRTTFVMKLQRHGFPLNEPTKRRD
jgi:DNA-binding protein Fis